MRGSSRRWVGGGGGAGGGSLNGPFVVLRRHYETP